MKAAGADMLEITDSIAAISSRYTNPKIFSDFLHLKDNRFDFLI